MQNLLDVKFDKFIKDFNLDYSPEEENWKRFVNYHFFSQFQPGRLDTDIDLLDQICVDSQEFPGIQGALFLMNDQILSESQDIDDILQRDQKGLLELYFLTFESIENFGKQLELLFHRLNETEKSGKWLDTLA